MGKQIKKKIQFKTIKLFGDIVKVLAPPPTLTVSQWADRYRKLSAEASAEPGQWNTDRAPYQRGIMDAVNDPETETVVVMSSAQVGKTELILNTIAYYIDYDPSPILILQPTLEMAQTFSKDRIAPMVRDSPALKDKVKDPRTRDSGNTMLHKKFPGGHLTIVGANSAAGLASRPIRIVLADEVDRYPTSAGSEGDPLNLAAKRTTTFWNKKKIYVSTPTIRGVSRIEAEYEDSTMEQWCLPCPCCGKYQPLTWAQIKFEHVTMECLYCGERFSEVEWKEGEGKWIPRKEHGSKRGFHLNELASPWKRWEEIIADFKVAKKHPETLKVWVNTALGESWEEQGEGADEEVLIRRRERYNAEIPDERILVLTAGVDVQDNRLEIEVVGWGKGFESWGIAYKTFHGDPGQEEVWQQLDDYLLKKFYYENGQALTIASTCIDSGGHFTTEVYKFCKTREHRRVFAVKGQGGEGIPLVGKVSKNNREKVRLFILGVDSGKELIISRLKINDEGAGYCHFPSNTSLGYTETYFKGLTSEQRVVKYHNGRPKMAWVKKSGTRNEPLDLRNYATAAVEILIPNFDVIEKRLKSGQNCVEKLKNTAQNLMQKRRGVVKKGINI